MIVSHRLLFCRAVVYLLIAALPVLLGACSAGLSNAPGINRKLEPEDFEHDVIANGPESCTKEGQDPLSPPGKRRRRCPEPLSPAAPSTSAMH
jgi:hypothetical protein